jgi:hypothetical protein
MNTNSKTGPKSKKPYWEMNSTELEQATREFDKEFVGETFTQPTPKQREQLAKAKRKRGRPRNGQGCRTISVTVERRLLAKADRLAKKLHVSRAALIAQGLQGVLAGSRKQA